MIELHDRIMSGKHCYEKKIAHESYMRVYTVIVVANNYNHKRCSPRVNNDILVVYVRGQNNVLLKVYYTIVDITRLNDLQTIVA